MKYDRLFVLIRHDSAEIWGFMLLLTRFFVALKVMASTGVFVRVIFALKRTFSCDAPTSSMLLTLITHKQSRGYQQNDLSRELPQGRQRT
jgi:hypothetical protein